MAVFHVYQLPNKLRWAQPNTRDKIFSKIWEMLRPRELWQFVCLILAHDVVSFQDWQILGRTFFLTNNFICCFWSLIKGWVIYISPVVFLYGRFNLLRLFSTNTRSAIDCMSDSRNQLACWTAHLHVFFPGLQICRAFCEIRGGHNDKRQVVFPPTRHRAINKAEQIFLWSNCQQKYW